MTTNPRFFILGDSYSTFEGCIPAGYAVYYSTKGRPETDVRAVEETWWHQLLAATDGELVRNCSWSGSTVCHTGYNGEDCRKKSFIARLDRLIREGFFAAQTVDCALIFGGTNDSWAGSPLGAILRDGQTEADLFAVRPALFYLARRLREAMPDTRTVFLCNTGLKPAIAHTMREAAAAYGHEFLALSAIDKSHGHPTILGMRQIAEQVIAHLQMPPQPAAPIPTVGHYATVVVGGGFAGVAAAIASARQGKRTLLVERYNCLGGAAAFDLVNPFMRYWTHDPVTHGRDMLSCGIFTEIVEQLAAFGDRAIDQNRTCFHEEYLKLVLNRLCRSAGVELLFDTTVTAVTRGDHGRITALTAHGTMGAFTITGDCFIDATGDGNLAFLAGCSYRLGRDHDNLCQPMTLCFRMAGVDLDRYHATRAEISPLYQKLQAEGKITNPREDVLIFKTLAPGVLHFNTTRVVKLDPTDPADITRAELEAREQVFEMVDFLKANFDAFRDAALISTGIRIGARESRMIIGEKTLTQEDLLAFRCDDDGIAVCNYDIDIHSPDGSGTSHYFFPDGKYYTIPYGALVPRGSVNLLVAGRCISATHEAQASLRIMPTCCTIGEAAGIAAAIALEDRCAVTAVNVAKLRTRLRTVGARVE